MSLENHLRNRKKSSFGIKHLTVFLLSNEKSEKRVVFTIAMRIFFLLVTSRFKLILTVRSSKLKISNEKFNGQHFFKSEYAQSCGQ
jgi:hypothetical protein